MGQHLKNIFSEGELLEDSVVKKFFTTAADGKKYKTNFYNLNAIISVGYRVKNGLRLRISSIGVKGAGSYTLGRRSCLVPTNIFL